MQTDKIAFRNSSNAKENLATITLYEGRCGTRVYLNYDEVVQLQEAVHSWIVDHSPCPICHQSPCIHPKSCKDIAQRKG